MLNLQSFIVDGELIIDKPHWYQLNNAHDRQELKDAISDAIEGLDLPLVDITEEEAKEDFDEKNKCIIEEGRGEEQFDLFLWYPSYFKLIMKSKPGKFLNIEEIKEKMYTETMCGVPFLQKNV